MTTPIPDWANKAASSILATTSRTQQEMARVIADFHSRVTQGVESAAELKATTLRRALVGIVGVDTGEELDQMEAIMRLSPIPMADKAGIIDAIHALKATL